MTRISCALCLVAVGLLGIDSGFADPAEAEDTAYRMARKYVEKAFAMAPTDHSGVCGGGTAIEFLIPVNKGLDYVFLVGTDLAARDVDIYVYDDVAGSSSMTAGPEGWQASSSVPATTELRRFTCIWPARSASRRGMCWLAAEAPSNRKRVAESTQLQRSPRAVRLLPVLSVPEIFANLAP